MAPLLTEEESALDPYTILAVSSTATEPQIRKAYRGLSLKYHPDRNPTPEAEIKFREISLSLEILVDVAKRAFVDNKLEGERRRKEKYAELDKKRKVLVDALNAREEAAKKAKVDAVERGKAAKEEENIKEAGRRMLAEAQKRMSSVHARGAVQADAVQPPPPIQPTHPSTTSMPPLRPSDLTLILTIPPSADFPATDVDIKSQLEGKYGPIEHLILKEASKKTKPRRTVIEFSKHNWAGCWACWQDYKDDEGAIKAKWLTGEQPTWIAWADGKLLNSSRNTSDRPVPLQSKPSFGSFISTTATDISAAQQAKRDTANDAQRRQDDFESMTLLKMRKLERQRLEEQIRREEA